MRRTKKYNLGDYLEMLNEIYTLCTPSFQGSMDKQGKVVSEIAGALRKRRILSFNNDRHHPEWQWVANMAPTKVLARNIYNDVSSAREKQRLAFEKRKAVNSLPNIPEQEIPVKNIEAPKTDCIEDTSTKIPEDFSDKLEDSFLVELLRQMGYTVSCTKTISL